MTECDLLCRIVPNCAEGTICNDIRSLLYTTGGPSAVSPLAGPGQSTGVGEAPGTSEKFAFYNTKEAKKHLCGAFF